MDKSDDRLQAEKTERPYRTARRERLAELVKQEGGPTNLADLIDTPKTHISAMLAGSRNVGDDLATKIESRLNKPHGWMDQSIPVSHSVSEPLAAYRVTPAPAGNPGSVTRELQAFLNSLDPVLLASAREILHDLVDAKISQADAQTKMDLLMVAQSALSKPTGTG